MVKNELESRIISLLTDYPNEINDRVTPNHFSSPKRKQIYRLFQEAFKPEFEESIFIQLLRSNKMLADFYKEYVDYLDFKSIHAIITALIEEQVKEKIRLTTSENFKIEDIEELLQETPKDKHKVITGKDLDDIWDSFLDNKKNRIPSPVELVQERINGFSAVSLNLIGARPSVGKSAFLEQHFWAYASSGVKSLFISIEQSPVVMFQRQFSRVTGVDPIKNDISKELTKEFKEKTAEQIGDSKILCAQVTCNDIEDAIKHHKPRVVMIDYAQIVESSGKTDYEKLTNISKELARIKNQHKVCLIVAVQFNRNSTGQPTLKDIKGSGQFEQDADTVIALWRNDYEEKGYKKVNVDCIKNRMGATFFNSSDNIKYSLMLNTGKFIFEDSKRVEELLMQDNILAPDPMRQLRNNRQDAQIVE